VWPRNRRAVRPRDIDRALVVDELLHWNGSWPFIEGPGVGWRPRRPSVNRFTYDSFFGSGRVQPFRPVAVVDTNFLVTSGTKTQRAHQKSRATSSMTCRTLTKWVRHGCTTFDALAGGKEKTFGPHVISQATFETHELYGTEISYIGTRFIYFFSAIGRKPYSTQLSKKKLLHTRSISLSHVVQIPRLQSIRGSCVHSSYHQNQN
jgi:hypothetical protein